MQSMYRLLYKAFSAAILRDTVCSHACRLDMEGMG